MPYTQPLRQRPKADMRFYSDAGAAQKYAGESNPTSMIHHDHDKDGLLEFEKKADAQAAHKHLPSAMRSANSYQSSRRSVSARKVAFKVELESRRYFRCDEAPRAVNAPLQERPKGELQDLSARKLDQPVFLSEITSSPQLVQLHMITFSENGTHLYGTVAVRNIAYKKLVHARFSLDSWNTVSETCADWSNTSADGQIDYFKFVINLTNCSFSSSTSASSRQRELALCVRYVVNGQVHWDNNKSSNYLIKLCDNKSTEKVSISSGNSRIIPTRHLHEAVPSVCLCEGNNDTQIKGMQHLGTAPQRGVVCTKYERPTITVQMPLKQKYNLANSFLFVCPGILPSITTNSCGTQILDRGNMDKIKSSLICRI